MGLTSNFPHLGQHPGFSYWCRGEIRHILMFNCGEEIEFVSGQGHSKGVRKVYFLMLQEKKISMFNCLFFFFLFFFLLRQGLIIWPGQALKLQSLQVWGLQVCATHTGQQSF